MKLVIQTREKTISKPIEEKDLAQTITWIKTNYQGREVEKGPYEHFRYVLSSGGAIVIYKDNKILRTRNTWVEIRALAALSKQLGIPFEHGAQIKFENWNTEIDGLNESEKVMVEVKYQKINQEWIDYYYKKLKQLGLKHAYIIAKDFENVVVPKEITLMRFYADFDTPQKYYQEQFQFPDWIREHIKKRHVRLLLPNGRWTGIKKVITDTAKHTMETKFRKQLYQISKRETPIKIYYSIARMINPVSEYFGKGYPLPYLILVFDIDTHEKQIIDKQGICKNCFEKAKPIAKIVAEKIIDEGFKPKIVFSGMKGFHVYALSDDRAIEVSPDNMFAISFELKDYVDNIHFKGRYGFDTHRIIKLPNSVDLSTGILIREKFSRLPLKDKLEEIK